MRFRTNVLAVMMLLIIAFVLPAQVWACACCADDGEYSISFSDLVDRGLTMNANDPLNYTKPHETFG